MTGCASFKRQASVTDPYDAVKIDQVVGNKVSSAPLQRTIVCLNPRRETRQVTLVTNVTVGLVTNVAVVTLTNQSITVITNASRTLATNTVAPPPTAVVTATNEAGAEASAPLVVAPPLSDSTNETVTTAHNITLSKSPNQVSSLANFQTQSSRQITVSTNNLSVITADNQTVSAETNQVVTTQTNLTIVPVTNVVVQQTNVLLRDYYLFTELTPPPDFTLQSGESLVLLVDGVRHGFSSTTSPTLFVSRKGYTSTLYRVPPELLVDIANANEVRIRIKGATSVLERKMTRSSRQTFKKFLVKHFSPEPPPPTPPEVPAQAASTTSSGS